jgi:aquaporin Z
MNIRALVAEAVGTFVLVFVGFLGVTTFIISTQGQGDPLNALLILPFAFGLGLLAAIAIGGHASGGHYNPAVTLAALLDGRVGWMDAIGYAVAQMIGALGASVSILLLVSPSIVASAVNQPGPIGATPFEVELHAFAAEAVLTAIFIAVILTVTKKSPQQAIVVIPLTLVVIHFVGIFTSGASVNPARSLAPAMVAGKYESLWVYLTGPFVGSVVGWAIYRFLTPPDDEVVVDVGDLDEDMLELDEDDAA